AWTIFGPRTRRAFICAAGLQSRFVESMDRALVLGGKADMHTVAGVRRATIVRELHPEFRCEFAKGDAVRHEFHDPLVAERFKNSIVKAGCALDIDNANRHMMQHAHLCAPFAPIKQSTNWVCAEPSLHLRPKFPCR